MNRTMTKEELREEVRARRIVLEPTWCEAESARVHSGLHTLLERHRTSMVGLYMALPGEVMLDSILEALMHAGCGVCVPCLDRDTGRYGMARVTGQTRLIEAAFGLREPQMPDWVHLDALDCVVVPGVAFDVMCRRVGHGGGHYDRLLSQTSAIRIGVGYDFQIFDRVPADAHDVAMHWVVSPSHIYEQPGRPNSQQRPHHDHLHQHETHMKG